MSEQKERRKYDREFKIEAVRLYEFERQIDACDRTGIGDHAVPAGQVGAGISTGGDAGVSRKRTIASRGGGTEATAPRE